MLVRDSGLSAGAREAKIGPRVVPTRIGHLAYENSKEFTCIVFTYLAINTVGQK